MEQKLKLVDQYFGGCNCSQTVLCIYAKEIGISEDTAYRLAESFGGGIAGTRNICGALVGAIIALGYFSSEGLGTSSKHETYKKTRELMDAFEQLSGATVCSEILKVNEQKSIECDSVVKNAIKAVEQIRNADNQTV